MSKNTDYFTPAERINPPAPRRRHNWLDLVMAFLAGALLCSLLLPK